ncbi:MAG: signal peptide peptidase SppA [Muribaculaceae bacterium]|nr:signal peptide peptidase SppA [Muribaculaceae bacterium]
MLKRFFLNALSSFLGAWIALAIFGVVFVMVIISLVGKFGSANIPNINVSKGSVMTLDLEGEIIENDIPAEFDYTEIIQGEIVKKKSLSSIIKAIETAAENRNIDAIYLRCGVTSAAPATFNAIREALLKFKESGKKILAYANTYMMGDYFVATVADEIYLNPGGTVALQGLGGINFFFKDLLDKLGVDVQVVKVGTYKSAVEPYILNSMSQPARAQLDTLYGNMWRYIREGMSAQRKNISPAQIDSLVSNDFIFIRNAKYALNKGLVDSLAFERSMDSIIASSLGKNKDKLNFVPPYVLTSQEEMMSGYMSKNQIAVLYASGEIIDGGGNSSINYQRFVPIITELADNENVKGMVLRVNSPGGSVFGSEQIGDALDYFRSKGKPLAVSMGDYAASGGYWISCCANKIFADPLTITGSIGIFGLIPNVDKLMQKIGLNAEIVATNPEAQFPNFIKPLNQLQLDAMQKMVSEGYDQFIARVAKGRNLPEAEVRRIGEGRVWDAESALRLKLVDALGGLDDAIDWVSKEIDNDNYTLSYYPRMENSVWDFLPEIVNMQLNVNLYDKIGEDVPVKLYDRIMRLLNQYPVQARMPEISVTL